MYVLTFLSSFLASFLAEKKLTPGRVFFQAHAVWGEREEFTFGGAGLRQQSKKNAAPRGHTSPLELSPAACSRPLQSPAWWSFLEGEAPPLKPSPLAAKIATKKQPQYKPARPESRRLNRHPTEKPAFKPPPHRPKTPPAARNRRF